MAASYDECTRDSTVKKLTGDCMIPTAHVYLFFLKIMITTPRGPAVAAHSRNYYLNTIIASFRFEDDDENENQGQLLLTVRMFKSVTVMA